MAIHPAEGEAFSLSILEYMSAGLAVIVPDTPSVSQAIDHEHGGLGYPRGDSGAAQAVARLQQHGPLRQRLGEAAARAVRERYSLRTMNQTFRETLDEALNVCSDG